MELITKRKFTPFSERKECQKCHYYFAVDDLDLENGRWLCRNCDEDVREADKRWT